MVGLAAGIRLAAFSARKQGRRAENWENIPAVPESRRVENSRFLAMKLFDWITTLARGHEKIGSDETTKGSRRSQRHADYRLRFSSWV